MNAAEAPIRGDLDQVWPLVAVRHHVTDVLIEVQNVPAVSKVPVVLAIEGKIEEGLVKIKAVMARTIATAAIRLGVISLSITIVICPFFFIGQDLHLKFKQNKIIDPINTMMVEFKVTVRRVCGLQLPTCANCYDSCVCLES